MLKKILVPIAACTVLILGALPAVAQAGVSASINGISSGQTITGCTNVRGNGSASSGVKKLEIFINGGSVKSNSWSGIQSDQTLDYNWCTNGGRNGEYSVKVVATAQAGSSAEATIRVKVDNAPAAPTGVAASQTDGVVQVSWNGNSESDLIGYRVERDSGSGWNSLGQTSSTTLSDSPGAGDHSYRVVALRNSPSSSGGKASSPSGAVSVNVPQPPPPSSDGGTGGGTGSKTGSGSGGNGAGGNSVPGYGDSGSGKHGGGKKFSNKNGGSPAPGFAPQGGGSFTVGGKTLGGIGLPGALSLPGGRGLPDLPSVNNGSASISDGTFEETLPYDLDDAAGLEFLGEGNPGNVAAVSTSWSVVPPDGLRWVAAGLWFLVTAALLRFLERRLAKRELLELAGETATGTERSEDEDASTLQSKEPVPAAGSTTVESAPGADHPRCAATTKAGAACRNRPQTSSDYCHRHAVLDAGDQEESAALRLVKEEDAA